MPTFSSKPLPRAGGTNRGRGGAGSGGGGGGGGPSWRNPAASLPAWLRPRVRSNPFLFFGLPFVATLVAASFGLSSLTQTRYDYNATKVSTLSKEEELRMRKDRRRIDIREEYFRLQSKESELDNWEPKRIERPAGVPEWGVPPAEASSSRRGASPTSSSNSGQLHADEAPLDEANHHGLDVSAGASGKARRPNVVLGPDGKPCRACNSRLAFSAAMRQAGGPKAATGPAVGGGPTTTKTASSSSSSPGARGATTMATLTAAAATSSSSSAAAAPPDSTDAAAAVAAAGGPVGSDGVPCPPDGEEIGRSTWTFLHTAAAYYPDSPSEIQREAMRNLLRALPHVYPCASCAEALAEEYGREASRLPGRGGNSWEGPVPGGLDAAVDAGGATLRTWLCGIHNEVNARLGKTTWNCRDDAALQRRWKDGPEDGSCD